LPNQPLVGYLAEQTTDPKQPGKKSWSDHAGVVRVPATTAGEIVWLSVKSGDIRLARVPLLPGSPPELTLELPDDTVRLHAEGELAVLEAKLVETVARRAVLMARIRSRATASDWSAVQADRKALAALTTARQFEERLTAIRIPALDAAREQKNGPALARIGRRCREVADAITRYLDADKLKAFEEEIQEIRAAEQSSRRPK
jgi:hypothetical protein